MKVPELELWKELDNEQAEKISGGSSNDCSSDGCIAWSIGFADVVRPSSSSQASSTIAPPTGKIRGTLLL